MQIVTKPEAQYKAWYGLPATPEILALDPDYDEAGEALMQSHKYGHTRLHQWRCSFASADHTSNQESYG
jgi:hypothetical protein